ncbi:MAG: serine hydrolase domain-containing protein [Polymorphobacter sp.]|uniref:serine hydrolase domain-containing protein n=1 Tax=Polymorphobacter sp. TaxID=1909290 RepID=UPI003A8AACC3
MQTRLETALRRALEGTGIPGVVAMVVDADGVRAQVALGHAADARFSLASMTKAIVSVGALKLVEQGRLALDAPLGAVLPALAAPQILVGFEGDTPILTPASTPMTLRHLLTHTSGFGYDHVQAEVGKARRTPPVPGTFDSITMPLLFEPGSGWAYGVSTDWAALAMAAVIDEPLDVWLTREILAPLGMHDTRYGAGDVPLLIRGEGGVMAPFPAFSLYDESHEFIPGGAGLAGPVADYARFVQMLLRGGDGMLSAEMAKAFATNQVGALRAGLLPSVSPWLAQPFDPLPGQHCGWGLGTLINPEPGSDGRSAGSLSWTGIANTYFWVDATAGLGAIVMMQHLPFADPAALAVVRAAERAIYA